MITYLAIIFIIFLVLIAFYGFGFILKNPQGQIETEKCEVCRNSFEKKDLVERQIGDFKLVYFCTGCISNLANDEKIKN